MNSLKIILLAFSEICLLKRDPQDLPVSALFLVLCAATYTITSFILALIYQNLENALTAALVDISFMVILTWLLLAIGRKSNRWIQTGTALLGTGSIFSLLAIPAYF